MMMRKLLLLAGMAVAFVAGSWAGRAPYERLQGAVRRAARQPKVQATLDTAAQSAVTVRDAALDATAGAIDDASKAATDAIDDASKKVSERTQKVAAKVAHGS